MGQFFKDHPITISMATIIAILLGVLAFGRTAGGYEARINENSRGIMEHSVKIQEIPVLKANQETLISGQKEMRQDIKTLLKRQ